MWGRLKSLGNEGQSQAKGGTSGHPMAPSNYQDKMKLTLHVGLVLERRRFGPPLEGEVGHLSGALSQQHTAPTKQHALQLGQELRETHKEMTRMDGRRRIMQTDSPHTLELLASE